MRICIFEDLQVGNLEPLSTNRPACDLWCGLTPLRRKQLRAAGNGPLGLLVRAPLVELVQQSDSRIRVNDPEWVIGSPVLYINARWLPDASFQVPPLDQPTIGVCENGIAYALLPNDRQAEVTSETIDEILADALRTLPTQVVPGRLIQFLWELVDFNPEILRRDYHVWVPRAEHGRSPENATIVGPKESVWIHADARLDPFVVLDTRNGPIVLDAEADVTAFSRIEGPCYIGRKTQIFGAKIRGGVTLGPQCRVGGEVETSIIQGFSNKYHDGFLGHAYLGEWVNIGAGTYNSDLRCDYAEVRMTVGGRSVNTGRSKIGCYLGDHVKTGLGSLLNTGTSVGIFSILLPSGELLPRDVPGFSVVSHGRLIEAPDFDRLLQTAAYMMSRRKETLTPAHERLFRRLFQESASGRRSLLREAEQRRLRRSA